MAGTREKATDLIAFLQDTVKAVLESRQVPNDQAEEIAVEVADAISFEWGGSMLYIPQGSTNLLCRRNEKILMEFTGSNHAELARKYKVSLQWLYKILKNKGKRHTGSPL